MVFSNFVDVYLKILESAIGPVRETIRKSNSNLTQRRIIIQKMKNFGDYLSSVNGIMELDLSAPAGPTLTNIRQPTSTDITLFRQCLAQR
ncbi:hypothetical protein EB796_018218 [Bugula neritina]|uniref:Uncharacterized protein n=1 Tax=Bugula neritina TaxID=10212 RepID=A0A7J7JB28_BUGNE|nr:hypothetical protein EB796_018218 [Bugula neritina]